MRYPLASVVVTQPFGSTAVDYSQFGLKGHHGVDLKADVGTPVYAPETGSIIVSQNGYTDPLSGKFVAGEVIVLRGIYDHWLLHLSKRNVSTGNRVTEGQLLGYSGNTGFTTGPHLHWGTRPLNPDMNNGYRGFVDPRNVIKSTSSAGGLMFQNDQEIKEAYAVAGRVPSAAEIAAWRGGSKQRFIQLIKAETDAQRKQLADVKLALANLQKQPPKEVIKEVIKIVEKPVPTGGLTPEESAAIKETNTIVKAIKDLLGRVFK